MEAELARAGLTGGCQYGAIRYRIEQAPRTPSICHCRMCQKAGGAPFMAFFSVPKAGLVLTKGAPAIYRSSDIAERGFCAACGTPLTYAMFGRGHVSLTIGSLDHPERIAPAEQLGVESMLPWFDGLANLPKSESSAWMSKYAITGAGSHQHPDSET
jgi:hypothetical protein